MSSLVTSACGRLAGRAFVCDALGLDGSRGLTAPHELIDLGLATSTSSRWTASLSARQWAEPLTIAGVGWLRPVIVAMMASALPFLGLSALMGAVFVCTGQGLGLIAVLLFILVFLMSGWVHEMGHLLALLAVRTSNRHVHLVTRLGIAHVIRQRTTRRREVAVVLSGPLLAAVMLITVGLVLQSPLSATIAFSLGGIHLAQLGLPSGDGGAIRRALRSPPANDGRTP
ncbi:hypothetical protein [Curtobacterium sp. RRHDQ10]|uniref:hypothetical protein n=1 Tax=Curtobacterium phyllosphaerae TaxID=3413379 RepID=UPI003BF11C2B